MLPLDISVRKALFLFLALLATTAFAQENKLIGAWQGNDRASAAIYGTIIITNDQISWGGYNRYNPPCRATYSIVSVHTSETYSGNALSLKKGRTFEIYKLRLAPIECARGSAYIQFALPSDGYPRDKYAEVVTYTEDERQTGWHNFTKVEDGKH